MLMLSPSVARRVRMILGGVWGGVVWVNELRGERGFKPLFLFKIPPSK